MVSANRVSVPASINCLRWENINSFLYDIGRKCNVGVEIDSVEKGWFRKTVHYTIHGHRKGVQSFLQIVDSTIEEENSERVM